MSNNVFAEDHAFSKRYRGLLKIFYRSLSQGQDPYYYDGDNHHEHVCQKRMHIDLELELAPGKRVGIEEKIIRWPTEKQEPHTCFYLETESCTNPGRMTPGWMQTGEAEYLLYAFEILPRRMLDIHFLPFQVLKRWFWMEMDHSNRFFSHRNPEKNQSQGKLVPISLVKQMIPGTRQFRLSFDGKIQELVRPYQPELGVVEEGRGH